ncbi:3'-5' exonuclease [Methylobacterium radiotolerans]|jgi:DNA polymerase-3 subunit epsilon|uniref:3'-5' exonuclease n=1 Tax=Methylobacterium TaxID=407 RepID=UPI0005E5DAB2|nr:MULTISPECIES: 3'-5' exonuclease [Methylobacterium]MBN6819442.1 3'-5' exonuclease [Methylobacterium organophilum]OXE40925.1 DNA polymerase III subunit epsilon [Methylobacterium radiotolerans]GAN47624.1 DNA polymerase III epsilon subunit-like 3'-5' exonuclease [Methylobacterium sp. ME121]
MDRFQAELHAIALQSSSHYRVLRKLERRGLYEWPLPDRVKIAILLDCETTGLNPHTDEIIELGMLRVAYNPTGTILGPIAEFQSFREPSRPIPSQITPLTGITDAMVAGHRIDETALRAFVADADLIIAHNANFDRRFCERLCPVFIDKAWACSQTQIPWLAEGVEGTKLFYIGFQQGFWFEGHRASDDCYALLEILEMPLPRSHAIAMGKLLENARRPTVRVWALGAPFEVKDLLRERGYRWNVGEDGRPRAWHREVERDQVEAELRYLDDLGFPDALEPMVTEVDAYIRFSDRLF